MQEEEEAKSATDQIAMRRHCLRSHKNRRMKIHLLIWNRHIYWRCENCLRQILRVHGIGDEKNKKKCS